MYRIDEEEEVIPFKEEDEMFIKKYKSSYDDPNKKKIISSTISIVGIPQACLQALLLMIITILVIVFHERGRPGDMALIALQMISISSFVPDCHENMKECLNGTTHNNYSFAHEETSQDLNQRLFNVVCIPFLILCSHVISTPFFIGYIRETSEDNSHNSNSILQKNLKIIELVVLLVVVIYFYHLNSVYKLLLGLLGKNDFLI